MSGKLAAPLINEVRRKPVWASPVYCDAWCLACIVSLVPLSAGADIMRKVYKDAFKPRSAFESYLLAIEMPLVMDDAAERIEHHASFIDRQNDTPNGQHAFLTNADQVKQLADRMLATEGIVIGADGLMTDPNAQPTDLGRMLAAAGVEFFRQQEIRLFRSMLIEAYRRDVPAERVVPSCLVNAFGDTIGRALLAALCTYIVARIEGRKGIPLPGEHELMLLLVNVAIRLVTGNTPLAELMGPSCIDEKETKARLDRELGEGKSVVVDFAAFKATRAKRPGVPAL